MQPSVIVERPGAQASIVSDILDYFREVSPFQHYKICCSLRSKIDDALSKHSDNSSTDQFPLFVVVEEDQKCETPLDDGTCYVVDQEMVTGGRAGEEALLAWQVDNAPWPEVPEDEPGLVDTVLAAVKIVQDETEVIREVAEASCFYDVNGGAVYSTSMHMKANLSVMSPQTENQVEERVARMRTLVGAFKGKWRDRDRGIANLVEALRLENIDTDHYRRTWYLSLFEAIEAVLSERCKQEFHQRHRGYRRFIAHPKPQTKMDMEEFVRLQRDGLAELRRIFLGD